VLPLIVVAMILAVQNLMTMKDGGGKLARYTIYCEFEISHLDYPTSVGWVLLEKSYGADDKQGTSALRSLPSSSAPFSSIWSGGR
jgi:hypothetical protein